MTNSDLFGLQREARIKASGVREVFTPHKPIDSVQLFYGRRREVQKLVEQINTPGQHALLYGERGVGKSSLGNSVIQLLPGLTEGDRFIKRCDSSDTFQTITHQVLEQIQRARTNHNKNGITISLHHDESEPAGPTLSPSQAADRLNKTAGILMIDEADSIQTVQDRKRLAELIKLLSDGNSPFKLLVVGIAETAEQLTGAHPSVSRCLKETKLDRMHDSEIAQIITGGAIKLNLSFEGSTVDAIVKLSAGYPHFTHLLALKCAEEAIAEERSVITDNDLKKAMNLAVEDAEGSLSRAYNDAARSYGTEMYRTILVAASELNGPEFSAGDIRKSIKSVSGISITQQGLNNYFKRLVSDDGSTILRRVAKGVYRLSDPRMKSFIKIANGKV